METPSIRNDTLRHLPKFTAYVWGEHITLGIVQIDAFVLQVNVHLCFADNCIQSRSSAELRCKRTLVYTARQRIVLTTLAVKCTRLNIAIDKRTWVISLELHTDRIAVGNNRSPGHMYSNHHISLHFIFNYISIMSWSILTPLKIGMNIQKLGVIYLLNSLMTS